MTATWMIMGNYNGDPRSRVNSLAHGPHYVHRDIVDNNSLKWCYAVRGSGRGNQERMVAYIQNTLVSSLSPFHQTLH